MLDQDKEARAVLQPCHVRVNVADDHSSRESQSAGVVWDSEAREETDARVHTAGHGGYSELLA